MWYNLQLKTRNLKLIKVQCIKDIERHQIENETDVSCAKWYITYLLCLVAYELCGYFVSGNEKFIIKNDICELQ